MSFLETVISDKGEELQQRRARTPLAVLEARIAERRKIEGVDAIRDFRSALRGPGTNLIAELKARTPTIDAFNASGDLPSLATIYRDHGARAISIVVDEKRFGTSYALVEKIRGTVGLPILVKEFVIDPYQIAEARASGADAILLMVRLLDDTLLAEFLQLAHRLGMAALVETHDDSEIESALAVGASIIGVNNRDLDRLEVSLETGRRLLPLLPESCLRIAESGIHSREDILDLGSRGADAYLVGGALLASRDPGEKLQELLGGGAS